ncbi:hypothetical protein EDD11_005899 [Mortierella claussenii]|nr:hypothetical protein EDD11_005899 [Mortierella claussenii]
MSSEKKQELYEGVERKDRGNMSNALTDNLMLDLHIDLNTITLGTSVFVIFFCTFEIPFNMIIRRVGPHRWIPFLMCFWGLATASQIWLKDRTSFLICRALVGTFEAGYIPGIAIYLTTYYKREEMALRLSIFFGPTVTQGYFRFSGYLTERQELIAVTRLIRDNPSKADHTKKVVSKDDVWRAVTSPRIWPNVLIGFFGLLPSTPICGFAPLILKMLGFDALKTNLIIIPGYIWGLICHVDDLLLFRSV